LNELESISSFKVFPNPNQGRFSILIEGSSASEIEISIINILGEDIIQRNIHLESGAYRSDFELPDIKSGMYMLRLSSSTSSLHRKFIVE